MVPLPDHVKKKVIDNMPCKGCQRTSVMKANLEDIAKAAGVSKMTVSRVLRGGTGFSDDTRDRVVKVAERLGYVPEPSRGCLRVGSGQHAGRACACHG